MGWSGALLGSAWAWGAVRVEAGPMVTGATPRSSGAAPLFDWLWPEGGPLAATLALVWATWVALCCLRQIRQVDVWGRCAPM
jgi:hypothetical protein